MLIVLIFVWLPLLWLYTLTNFISFLPPFIVLIQMANHDDDAEHRNKLYKTYLIFTVIVGTSLNVITELIVYYNITALGV